MKALNTFMIQFLDSNHHSCTMFGGQHCLFLHPTLVNCSKTSNAQNHIGFEISSARFQIWVRIHLQIRRRQHFTVWWSSLPKPAVAGAATCGWISNTITRTNRSPWITQLNNQIIWGFWILIVWEIPKYRSHRIGNLSKIWTSYLTNKWRNRQNPCDNFTQTRKLKIR